MDSSWSIRIQLESRRKFLLLLHRSSFLSRFVKRAQVPLLPFERGFSLLLPLSFFLQKFIILRPKRKLVKENENLQHNASLIFPKSRRIFSPEFISFHMRSSLKRLIFQPRPKISSWGSCSIALHANIDNNETLIVGPTLKDQLTGEISKATPSNCPVIPKALYR